MIEEPARRWSRNQRGTGVDPNAKPKKPDPLDGLPQIERFKAMARELECDGDEGPFKAGGSLQGQAGPGHASQTKGRAKEATEEGYRVADT